MTKVSAKSLLNYCAALFCSVGVPEEEARITADILVEANLSGMDSHGVSRMAAYMERIRQGGNKAVAEVDVLTDFPAGATWDGKGSLGQVVAFRAMSCAIEKARQCGVGFIGVKGGNHTGANAYYARMAARENMIGLIAGNGPPMVAPWGSATAFFSTNPLSFGAPAGKNEPIIIDMATSVSARGRILLAEKEGKPIPLGWATDKEGNDTIDPKAALLGVLLPFGQHKGYAMALMVEILAGLLSGAGYGPMMNEHYQKHGQPVNSGNLFAAIDISKFTSLEEFKRNMDEAIEHIHSGTVRPGFKEILVPGEIEFRTRQQLLQQGIVLPSALREELLREGKIAGLALDLLD